MPAINVSQNHMEMVTEYVQILSMKSKTSLVEAAIEKYIKAAQRKALEERIRKSIERCAKINAEENREIVGAGSALNDEYDYEW